MVTIFHVPDWRSLRLLWRPEEMGVKADVKSLPFPPRRLRPDYLSVIPAGPVPGCRDGSKAHRRQRPKLPSPHRRLSDHPSRS
jgi:glutathione S-transferase